MFISNSCHISIKEEATIFDKAKDAKSIGYSLVSIILFFARIIKD